MQVPLEDVQLLNDTQFEDGLYWDPMQLAELVEHVMLQQDIYQASHTACYLLMLAVHVQGLVSCRRGSGGDI